MTANTWQLGLSDLVMVTSTGLAVPFQQAIRKTSGLFRWSGLGVVLYSTFEAGWLILWVNWPFMFKWTWTAQVFFTLHTIVLLMKMHSYAFYNGHLSTTEDRLSALDNPETASTEAVIKYPSSTGAERELEEAEEESRAQTRKEELTKLREDLATELTSPLGRVTFPQNLTMMNYVDYILCPTLCYELEYPRTKHRSWMNLFWKTLAVFGCIFLLTIVSEEFIVPVLNEGKERLEGVARWTDKGLILAETISMLLFPFMVTFLLVFLVIFEYVLGAFAEITCFADRHFYSDWWNSCDWLEFSREWNIPVHHFLRRHVYAASLPYLSKGASTALTFLVSALLHELIMGCITKKLRGYGFVAMMLQIPIVALQKTRLVRGRELFNVSFFLLFLLWLFLWCV
jgi:sterol O-acyltransferase